MSSMQAVSTIEEYVTNLYAFISVSLTRNDRQPQRPIRNVRVYGDENAIPTLAGQKTLHSRNKSSPALSTLVKAGVLKAAAKRTAFGDVSNTANGARPKDDTALDVKKPRDALEKLLPLNVESQPSTAFLKPAQRPSKASSLKSILDGVNNSAAVPVNESLAEAQQTHSDHERPPPARKLSKRLPAVYHDATSMQLEESKANRQRISASNAPLPPLHRELPPNPKTIHSAAFGLSDCMPHPKTDIARHAPQPSTTVDIDLTSSASTIDDAAALRSDGIYIDQDGEAQVYHHLDEYDTVDNGAISTRAKPLRLPGQSPQISADAYDHHSKGQRHYECKNDVDPTSEYREYWEEDDEENYEEEGYVTARSFKLRSDTTTSGATTVVFPKMTQRSKTEIAAAAALIKASKTPDEIDDEAWDTTMVAEYGDEIFQYMRELEVSRSMRL